MEAVLALFVLVAIIAVVIMSIVLHEIAHGWMASKCGDYTAEAAGRLTLNPIKHIDPIFTIAMPLFLLWISKGTFAFGGAKPVPINPYQFRNFKADYFKVSIAGLVVNLGLAAFFAALIRLNIYAPNSFGAPILWHGLLINLVLFTLNILPIPPLDGSRALRVLLPSHIAAVFDSLDRFGIIIVMFVVFFTPLFGIFFGFVGLAVEFVFRIDFSTYDVVMGHFRQMLSFIG
jgi:Zn-dependent protease